MGTFYIRNRDGSSMNLGSQFYPKSYVTKAIERTNLMGSNEVELTIRSAVELPLKIGGIIDVYNKPYFLNTAPGVEIFASNNFTYSCYFDGMHSLLERLLFFNVDKSELSFSLVGTVDDFMDIILYNYTRGGDIIAEMFYDNSDMPDDTETKLITFDNDNCLTALNKIVEAFGMRYSFSAQMQIDLTYHITITLLYKPETRKYTEKPKLGYGLTKIKTQPIRNKEFATILYGLGSDRNIPSNYREYSRFLKPLTRDDIFDSELVDEFGAFEAVAKVDNIYPRSNGSVTSLGSDKTMVALLSTESGSNIVTMSSPNNNSLYNVGDILTGNENIVDGSVITEVLESTFVINNNATGTAYYVPTTVTSTATTLYRFVDSSMDFDLNGTDEFGTEYLIDGLTAKVAFISGKLAGYSFALKKYTHSTKTFEIIPVTDERDLTMPDDDTFAIGVGDMYVLTDIHLPQSYITAAETELRDYIEDYVYPQISKPKVTVSFDIDNAWLRRMFTRPGGMTYYRTDDPSMPNPTYYARTINNIYECGILMEIDHEELLYLTELLVVSVERNILNDYEITKITLGENVYSSINLSILRWQNRFASRFNDSDLNKREAKWAFKYRQH